MALTKLQINGWFEIGASGCYQSSAIYDCDWSRWIQAQIAGRLLNFATDAADFPTVGDWVQVRLPENQTDAADG